MAHIKSREDLVSKLDKLERDLKGFNKNQAFLLGSGFLALVIGQNLNDDFVNAAGYLALGIVSINAIAYPLACRVYNSLKSYLDKSYLDKTN